MTRLTFTEFDAFAEVVRDASMTMRMCSSEVASWTLGPRRLRRHRFRRRPRSTAAVSRGPSRLAADPQPAAGGLAVGPANTRDVWRYTTPATIRAQWPHVVRHLGRTRAMWAWLLRIDRGETETLLSPFEVDDPTAFTRPAKGELTTTPSSDQIYEFACHEGNDSLVNMRRDSRAVAEKAGIP